ncbi:MAG TPA: hypothetical protein GX710_02855 [Clostridiales bacterium]|nr:hypothetical protein [Clostridiales bacterium]
MKQNINEIFDSYDLFSYNGRKKTRERICVSNSNISESEIESTLKYLDDFYRYCIEYGQIIADKYKTPFLPKSDEAKAEINKYLDLCKEKYPEIDDDKIIDIFSTVCWLSNR